MSFVKRDWEAYQDSLPQEDLEEDETPEWALEPLADDDKLKQLTILAGHYQSTEAEIAKTEENLKLLNERFRRIREDFIPDKMMELGIRKYTLTDGSTIGYSQIFAGKVLDEKAFDWLEANGYADAVKKEMKLEVSRVDDMQLEFIRQYITDHPGSLRNMSVKEKQAIHHMTLGAAIKALTKRGQTLPPELFETFIGNRASIKKGKSDE